MTDPSIFPRFFQSTCREVESSITVIEQPDSVQGNLDGPWDWQIGNLEPTMGSLSGNITFGDSLGHLAGSQASHAIAPSQ